MQGVRVCKKCLKGKSYKKFRGPSKICKTCSPAKAGVSHNMDIEYLLQEIRWDYVFGGARRRGKSLEDIMLQCEKNVRLLDADEIRAYAKCYQRNGRSQGSI
jgi:hypothetical protein